MPESLQELLGGRLARMPAENGDVLLSPPRSLGRPSSWSRPPMATGTTCSRRSTAAAQEGVIELDDSSVRFAHPLLASICYEQAPPWKRRAVHRALAGAVTDLEERARHLALAAEGPDAAASQLEAAAEQAAARGATAAAAELYELAAQLTPATEPGSVGTIRAQTFTVSRATGGPSHYSRGSSRRFRRRGASRRPSRARLRRNSSRR